MPITIPTLEAPSVQEDVRPTPYNNNAPAPNAFNTVASTAADAGNALLGKYKNEADSQAVREAHVQLQQYLNDGLEQVRRADGQNAAAVAQIVSDAAKKKAQDIWGGLKNDQQKRAFGGIADGELIETSKTAMRHVGEQIRVARQQTLSANIQLAQDAALRDPLSLDTSAKQADKIRGFVYGTEANGVHVAGAADMNGWTPEVARAFEREHVGNLYSAQAGVLLGLPNGAGLATAQELLKRHAAEMGAAQAADMAHKVQIASVTYQGGAFAQQIAAMPDVSDARTGLVDLSKASPLVDKVAPPGSPLNEATRIALRQRASDAAEGHTARETSSLDAVQADYIKLGSTNGGVFRPPETLSGLFQAASFKRASPEVQMQITHRWEADRREAASTPMNQQQLEAFGSLLKDFADRATYWGTVPNGALEQDPRFNILPITERQRLTAEAAGLRADRTNPQANLNAATPTIKEIAQQVGILAGYTKNTKYEEWHNDQKAVWDTLLDNVGKSIQAWHADPANKGKALSRAEIAQMTMDARRAGVVKDGTFSFLDGGRWLNLYEDEAAQRPLGQQAQYPFQAQPYAPEDKAGRYVLYMQGLREDEMTPARILQASHDYTRVVGGGPGMQDTVRISNAIRAAGKVVTPESVQGYWEREQLRYVPAEKRKTKKPEYGRAAPATESTDPVTGSPALP